ncbi:putative redox protein [Marchantia polymorpha subsp. ruderalis]|uniref:OsmC family protein n=2 Tax=Marchantia polymorpha TaxID=3197 RepID=A0AAF6AUX3_MARPO|nr:hypothetical protein MARPO_0002s0116 [Marchantia polymorpha]BBN00244.1 hypothetical protein Mp_1g27620 [Marchantia polymorpha subsp. ruderalis]|eukprot:PTQ49640.1 hypothetical protein MARPO_0002s0116 [Marchantia polymorpha]
MHPPIKPRPKHHPTRGIDEHTQNTHTPSSIAPALIHSTQRSFVPENPQRQPARELWLGPSILGLVRAEPRNNPRGKKSEIGDKAGEANERTRDHRRGGGGGGGRGERQRQRGIAGSWRRDGTGRDETMLRSMPLPMSMAMSMSKALRVRCRLRMAPAGPQGCAATRCATSSSSSQSSQSSQSYQGHVAVSSEDESGARYQHVVRAGGHTFRGDLGAGWGAAGSAPEPKDYALGALAVCTSMTVRLYADRRRWSLRHVQVTVVEQGGGMGLLPDGLRMLLRLDGDLTDAQRSALVEVSKKCPIKQMFLGKMPHGVHVELDPAAEQVLDP